MVEEEKQMSKISTSLTSPQEVFQSSSKKPTPTIDTMKFSALSALSSEPVNIGVSKSSLLPSNPNAMKSILKIVERHKNLFSIRSRRTKVCFGS